MKKSNLLTVIISLLIGAVLMFFLKGSLFMNPSQSKFIDDDVQINIDPNFESIYLPSSSKRYDIDENSLNSLLIESKEIEKPTIEIDPKAISNSIDSECWKKRPQA